MSQSYDGDKEGKLAGEAIRDGLVAIAASIKYWADQWVRVKQEEQSEREETLNPSRAGF